MCVKKFLLTSILFAGSFFNLYATPPNCEVFIGRVNAEPRTNYEQFIIRFPEGINVQTNIIPVDTDEFEYHSRLRVTSTEVENQAEAEEEIDVEGGVEGDVETEGEEEYQSEPLDLFLEGIKLKTNQQGSELQILSSETIQGFMDGCDSCKYQNSYRDKDVLKAISRVKKIVDKLQEHRICRINGVPCLIDTKNIDIHPKFRYELRLRNKNSNPLHLHSSDNLSRALELLLRVGVCSSR